MALPGLTTFGFDSPFTKSVVGGGGGSGLLGFDMKGSLLSGAGGGAAKAGMFANPVGLALAGGQLAFGIANMVQQDKVATQQAYNQAYNTTYNNVINQFKVDQQNQQIAASYNAKLDYTKLQIENNFLAASAAWSAEQMRLNDIYGRAAYKSQAMQKLLAEAMGTAAAREVYGKSAQRGAAVATLGAYGRSRAQLVDQLMSENAASAWRNKQVEQKMKAQNKLAIAQTAVLPMAATFSPTPMAAAGGSNALGMAAQGLGIGMSAFATGYGVTPSGGSFLGIQKA